MSEDTNEKPAAREDEKDDAASLLRLVQAYCAKHPGGTVTFAIATNGSDKMKLHEMGDPEVRVQMAMQFLVRAKASIQQMERTRVVRPGEVGPRAALALLRQGRGMQGG